MISLQWPIYFFQSGACVDVKDYLRHNSLSSNPRGQLWHPALAFKKDLQIQALLTPTRFKDVAVGAQAVQKGSLALLPDPWGPSSGRGLADAEVFKNYPQPFSLTNEEPLVEKDFLPTFERRRQTSFEIFDFRDHVASSSTWKVLHVETLTFCSGSKPWGSFLETRRPPSHCNLFKRLGIG